MATKAQIIGSATEVVGLQEIFGDIDGIGKLLTVSRVAGARWRLNDGLNVVGLGPSDTNFGEVTGFNFTPTFVETLKAEGAIDESVFGLFLAPIDTETGRPEGQGEITFGGVDQSKIQG